MVLEAKSLKLKSWSSRSFYPPRFDVFTSNDCFTEAQWGEELEYGCIVG